MPKEVRPEDAPFYETGNRFIDGFQRICQTIFLAVYNFVVRLVNRISK